MGVVQEEDELPVNMTIYEAMKAVQKIIGHKAGKDDEFNEWKELKVRPATDEDKEDFTDKDGVLVNKNDDILVTDSTVLREANGKAKRDPKDPEKILFGEQKRVVYTIEEEAEPESPNRLSA